MESLGRNLRTIVAGTILASIILFGSGLAVSFLWPSHFNSMLESLLLNVIGSLIGVLVGVLTAIFIVEKYLERRRQEHEREMALEEKMYQALWQNYTSAGGTGVCYYIAHVCLFLTCGKKVYVESTGNRQESVPDSVHDFIDWFQEETKKQVEAGGNPLFRPPPFDDKSDNSTEHVSSMIRALKESECPETTVCPGDLLSIVRLLKRLKTYLKDQIFLFQPFMSRRYGVAVAMTDLSRELDDTLELIKRIVSEVPKDVEPTKMTLGGYVVAKYRKLGLCALDVVKMVWAGRQDFNVLIDGSQSSVSEPQSTK